MRVFDIDMRDQPPKSLSEKADGLVWRRRGERKAYKVLDLNGCFLNLFSR
jgi:hypothetical protein